MEQRPIVESDAFESRGALPCWGWAIGQVGRNVLSRPLPHVLCVSTVAVTVFLLGTVGIVAHNVFQLTRAWGEEVSFTVYLDPATNRADVARIRRWIDVQPGVRRVQLVSPEEAVKRLTQHLGAVQDWVGKDEITLLPASLEVRLDGHPSADEVARWTHVLTAMNGVAEVDDTSRWAEQLRRLSLLLRRGIVVFAILVAAVGLVVIGATVRLSTYERRHEIAVQTLLGATPSFVRLPFVVEGALQGMIGAATSICFLFIAYRWAAVVFAAAAHDLLAEATLTFLPFSWVAGTLACALMIGTVGGAFAAGRPDVAA